ncbi:MAG: hypothetical protein A2751_02635 [Candidatus Doudnabacteria bacterium RIFCSPHIGHO2_01_FULL_46_14]|uniref:Uncharacterized protein n=1 Tax=Candidatus Doudnabacteria bacterium RIFCSPHIGHO2_01_FULL_46_14 TaxID=1817824 RepID=A0A1F5NJP6_9BACT|nr:MAG: hypothetical protein A2751_02635 [Candidatus Doudnabacteria bacterium RIFCSPHIGHO2_01_FULL_46_14]
MGQIGNDRKIETKSFFKGKLRSVGPIGADGLKRYTVGIFLPRQYEFTADTRGETIVIVDGTCTINGQVLKAGEKIFISGGEKVVIEATETCAYFCWFGQR